MRKSAFITGCLLLLAFVLTGCSTGNNIGQNGSSPSASPAASETPPAESPSDNKTASAEAYYLVFKDLFEKDPGLNDGIAYLALDLSAVKASDTDSIAELFKTFCENNDLTLLLDTYDGLTAKGYIKEMFFEKGLLISFKDQSLTETELVTEASKWRSGDGADGATYTIAIKDGIWEISDISGMWIS